MLRRATSLAVAALSVWAIAPIAPSARGQTLLYHPSGEEPGLRFGSSVAAAGDVDQDGVPDFAVGSSPWRRSHYAIVELRSGRTGDLVRTLQSAETDDRFGSAMQSLGDIDGDGVPDLVVGSPWTGHAAGGALRGAVRAYSGSDGSLLWTALPPAAGGGTAGFGHALDAVGDVDGDATPDLVVGTCSEQAMDECVRVLSGRNGTLIFSVCKSAFGGGPSTERIGFGTSVAGPGDVDQDGFQDLLVGAPLSDLAGRRSGAAYLISGRDRSLIWSSGGPCALSTFGTVSRAGDVDLDGHPDFAVGAPLDRTTGRRAGSVRVYSGSDHSVLRLWHGWRGSRLGCQLSARGDANGDGREDLTIGVAGDSNVWGQIGGIGVFSGSNGAALAWVGDLDSSGGVSPAAFVGDINGDGSDDMVAGAPTQDEVVPDSGSARVYLMGFAPPVQYCFPTFNSFNCGSSLVYQGVPSVSVGEPLVVTATYILNRQMGYLVWGREAANFPFGPGTMCVRPRFRGPVQDSGGSPAAGSDCSGVFVFRFTREYLAAHGVGPGDQVHCQFVSREPHLDPPYNVMLTDAIVFTVVPYFRPKRV